jgi:tetratricopeptide (TPR) repeat protein
MEEKLSSLERVYSPSQSGVRPDGISPSGRWTGSISSDESLVYAEGIQSQAVENHIASLLSNAKLLLKHQETGPARALVYKALALNSNHSVALKMATEFLDPKKDFEDIRKIINVLCSVDYCFENVARKARCHYDVGDDQNALKFYYEAMSLVIEETPALFDVYKNVGNILTREKDYDGAEEYYYKAFTIQPDSDVLRINLGTLAMQKQDMTEALDNFRKAVAANPKNEKAWVGLALVHQMMGDMQLAIGNLETALDLNPENRTAVHLFVNWVIQNGYLQRAIERLEDYLGRVDSDPDLSLVLIQLFCQTSRLDLALLELERLLLWNPHDEKLLGIEKELREEYRKAE